MIYLVKRLRGRIVIGGLIILSGLALIFPEKIGLVVGLVIGLLIMVMEQFGLKMGNWGRELGGWIGNWAIGFGEWMGASALGFARIIEGIDLLQYVQMFGFLMMIIAGLSFFGMIIYNNNRTKGNPDAT